MPGPGKCKTADRKKNKPAQKRYVAEHKKEANEERKKTTAAKAIERKKTKTEKRIKTVKIAADYRKIQHICPKMCANAHREMREKLHLNPTLPSDGFAERFKRDHPLTIEDQEKRDWMRNVYPHLSKSYTMAGGQKKKDN